MSTLMEWREDHADADCQRSGRLGRKSQIGRQLHRVTTIDDIEAVSAEVEQTLSGLKVRPHAIVNQDNRSSSTRKAATALQGSNRSGMRRIFAERLPWGTTPSPIRS